MTERPGIREDDAKALEGFLEYVRYERNLSAATSKAYEEDLAQFLRFTKREVRQSVKDVVRADVLAFFQLRARAGIGPRTRARQLSAIRRFFRYLQERENLESNPTDLIEAVKLPFRHPTTLAPEEVVRLLEAPDTQTPEGIRDRALLEFMYATGVRVSEACNLELTWLHLGERWVRVEGKGGKQRLVPIAESAAGWLEFYLEKVRALLLQRATRIHAEARTRVFVSRRGKGLSRQAVWKLIGKYAVQADLREDVHPHVLRHCFATHLLINGADLRVVQALLGHSDISTTEVYTHLAREDLRRDFQRYHPRGR